MNWHKKIPPHWLASIAMAMPLALASYGQTTNVTSNIAGFQRVTLNEGRNFVGLPLVPTTNTLVGVVGTSLPANATESSASAVDFWDQTSQALTNRSWLSTNANFPGWRAARTFADNSALTFDPCKGFIVTVRVGQGSQDLLLAGLVATSGQSCA